MEIPITNGSSAEFDMLNHKDKVYFKQVNGQIIVIPKNDYVPNNEKIICDDNFLIIYCATINYDKGIICGEDYFSSNIVYSLEESSIICPFNALYGTIINSISIVYDIKLIELYTDCGFLLIISEICDGYDKLETSEIELFEADLRDKKIDKIDVNESENEYVLAFHIENKVYEIKFKKEADTNIVAELQIIK